MRPYRPLWLSRGAHRVLLAVSLSLLGAMPTHGAARVFAEQSLWWTEWGIYETRFLPDRPAGGFALDTRLRFSPNAGSGMSVQLFDSEGVRKLQLNQGQNAVGGFDGSSGLVYTLRNPAGSGVIAGASRYVGNSWSSGYSVTIPNADLAGGATPAAGDHAHYLIWVGQARVFRLAANGTTAPGWPAAGRAIAPEIFGWPLGLMTDPSDGAIAFLESDSGTVMRRVHASGVLDPTWSTAAIAPVGAQGHVGWADAGGYWLTYQLGSNFTTLEFRVIRLTPSGSIAPGWTSSGLRFGRHRAVPTSNGGLVAIDSAGGAPHLRVVLPDGSQPLGPEGVAVAPAGSSAVVGPGDGDGFMLAWSEVRDGLQQVRVRPLQANGLTQPTWPDTGVLVSPGQTNLGKVPVAVRTDEADGALVVWNRWTVNCSCNCCGTSQVYTHVIPDALLDATPVLSPSRLGLALLGAHPARGTMRLALESADPGELEVSLHDLAGRELRRERVAGGTRREFAWPTAGLRPGVYLARAQQASHAVSRRVVVVE